MVAPVIGELVTTNEALCDGVQQNPAHSHHDGERPRSVRRLVNEDDQRVSQGPIDGRRSGVAQAKRELLSACREASSALHNAKMTSTQIATEATAMAQAEGVDGGFNREDVARIRPKSGPDELAKWRPPSEELCQCLDAVCHSRGVGSFELHSLWTAWSTADGDARHDREPVSDLLRVGVPPGAAAMQPRSGLLEKVGLESPTVRAAVVRQVARGDGGMGKTMLARQVWDQAEAAGWEVLVWAVATSRVSVVATYADAARAAGLATTSTEPDTAADAFRSFLSRTSLRWLVVLDDVGDAREMRNLWPPSVGRGHTVITTRSQDLRLAGAALVDVDVYTTEEARSYLRDRIGNDEHARTDALDRQDELIATLHKHPLALAQAAAYVVSEGITCQGYVQKFNDTRTTIGDLFPELHAADDYEFTVVTAWLIAIEAADALDPVGVARPALALASVLSPNGIPEDVWTSRPARDYLIRHRTHLDGADRFTAGEISGEQSRSALRNLHRFSVIRHNPNLSGAAAAVTVHALTQLSARFQLDRETVADTTWSAANAVLSLWPEHADDTILQRNVRALQSIKESQLINAQEGIHPLLQRAGEALGERGQPAAARIYFDKLVEQATSILGADRRDTLFIRETAARWQGMSGDHTGAVTAFENLVNDGERALGAGDPLTLDSRANLARWRTEIGDLAIALAELGPLYDDILLYRDPDDPNRIKSLHLIAYVRAEAGDLIGAIAELERLHPDFERVMGPYNSATLESRSNLAFFHGKADGPQVAATELEQLLRDRLEYFPPDDPATLTNRGNLARWRGLAGDPQRALSDFKALLADRLLYLDHNHPHVLATRRNIAYWRTQVGDIAGAIADYEELVDDSVRVHGLHHALTQGIQEQIIALRAARDEVPPVA